MERNVGQVKKRLPAEIGGLLRRPAAGANASFGTQRKPELRLGLRFKIRVNIRAAKFVNGLFRIAD